MDSSAPSPIKLDTHRGLCPSCRRPILTYATGKCSYCGASTEAALAENPGIEKRLSEMAPGWDLGRFKAWVRTRPALLARAMQEEAWPCLSAWVAEHLWRDWESREQHRKVNGQELRIGGVAVHQVSVLTLGDPSPWVGCRIVGRRSSFVVDTATGMVVSGNRGAKLFSEAWKLEATGLPDPQAFLGCRRCGAPMAPEDLRCGYCRNWQIPPASPWRLVALQDLMPKTLEGLPPSDSQHHNPFADFLRRDDDFGDTLFDGIMNNFIC